MLQHRKNEDYEEDDGPRAGFEVRVIGAARPAAPASKSAKGLEIGLQIGAGQANGPVDDSSSVPVQRLEAESSPEPLRARTIDEVIHEVGPATPYVPRRRRKQLSLTALTFWMAAVAATLTVAGVAGAMAMKSKQAAAQRDEIVFAPQQSFGEERDYFIAHLTELAAEAEIILGQYVKATSPEEVLPLVRDASRVKERLEALWQPMGPLSASQPVLPVFSESDVHPALILQGDTADFTPFEIVFVRENGHLKIDWEASHGIGDAQLSELRKSKSVVKGAKVRVVVQTANFYTPQFPESDYRSYQLLDASGGDFVWGYVRKSSRAADQLEAEFNEDSVLMEKTAKNPVTLRISGPVQDGVNLFEITEMLHKGWVSP